MGTWEEESTALFESHNESNKDVTSNETYHVGDDVDINVEAEVQVMNASVNGEGYGNCDGDECRDHENDVLTVEDAIDKQLESLKLQNSGGEYDGEGKAQVYPFRPYAEDCSFYIKTGNCKFGQTCRYNHPPRSGFQPVGNKDKGFEKRIEAVGDVRMIDCKYLQTPGGCKYGDGCRYNHSSHTTEREYLELNFLGLPKRPMAQECNYYLKHGSCAYGTNCKFHHPDPSTKPESGSGHSLANGNHVTGGINLSRNYHQPLQSFGGVSQGTSGSLNGMNPGYGLRFAPQTSSYQTMSETAGWNQNQVIRSYPANKSPLPHQHMNKNSKRVDMSAHYENTVHTEEFPKRSGHPDCDYFMKTGNCKYRSACKYNHPTSQVSKASLPPSSSDGFYSRPGTMLPARTSQFLSSNSKYTSSNGISFPPRNQQTHSEEFPERARQPECEFYMKTGQCKFKAACRYDHPRSRVPISSQCTLSEKGLPLRPGARLCRNYEQHGKCKHGRNCLFNHPSDYSTDVPDGAQFHSSTNVSPPAYLEPPVADNVNSVWDDGWGM